MPGNSLQWRRIFLLLQKDSHLLTPNIVLAAMFKFYFIVPTKVTTLRAGTLKMLVELSALPGLRLSPDASEVVYGTYELMVAPLTIEEKDLSVVE